MINLLPSDEQEVAPRSRYLKPAGLLTSNGNPQSSTHRWNSDSQLAKLVDAVIHNWLDQCSCLEQFCAYDRSHLLPYAKEGNGKHKTLDPGVIKHQFRVRVHF